MISSETWFRDFAGDDVRAVSNEEIQSMLATGGYSVNKNKSSIVKQESPAIADKPARRESLPKIAPIGRAYNVVADDTGLSSFV